MRTVQLPVLEVRTLGNGWFQVGNLVSCRVPEGYTLLPAGIVRRVRVTKEFFSGSKNAPPYYYIVPAPNVTDAGGYKVFCDDVQILGPSRMVVGEDGGVVRPEKWPACWVETAAAILVLLRPQDAESYRIAERAARSNHPHPLDCY